MADDEQKMASCRICHDDDKNEMTVSPCNCTGTHAGVHMTCLKRWLSVSETNKCEICNHSFETTELYTTTIEQENTSFVDFCRELLVWIVMVSVYGLMQISCGIQAISNFNGTANQHSFLNGIIWSIISIAMAALLVLWWLIFSLISERVNMTIRLVEDITDENNNTPAV